MPKPKQTCQNCRWWLPAEKEGERSLCVWLTGAGDKAGLHKAGNRPVYTKADFGCVEHQARKAK